MLPSQAQIDRKAKPNSSSKQPLSEQLITSGLLFPPNKPYIHDLPDDILLEIFYISVNLNALELDATPFQYILATACRRWRDLVLHAPLLWTSIRIPTNTSFDPFKHFERSQPALIDVQFDWVSSWARTESALPSRVSSAIAKHTSRLQNLTIRVWECQQVYPIIQAWKDDDAVNLKSLTIFSATSYDSVRSFPHSPFSSPNFTDFSSWKGGKFLRSLKLEGFEFQGFCALPNLTFLDVFSLNASKKEFQALLNNSPLLSILIIRQLDIPPHTADDNELQRQLEAPCLRSLAINISNNHMGDCGCFLPCLSMKNLEYLEVVFLWNTFTSHHTSIVSHWKNLPSLRKLRIHSVSIWTNDVTFLSSLPPTTDLEIIDFPKAAEPSLTYILNLNNLKSITFDLSSPRVSKRSLDAEVFSNVVRRERPAAGCPTVLQLPSSTEVGVAWLELQVALGNKFTIQSTSTENGFLDSHLNNQVFDDEEEQMIDGLWASDTDEEFEEEDYYNLNEFDYDPDEIEYLREDDIFDDYNDEELEYEDFIE